jgi:large repetitive protein
VPNPTAEPERRHLITFLALLVTALSALVWSAATPVLALASISVTASSSPSVLAGDSIGYTVGVTNSGDEVQYNVSVTATLAPDVDYETGSTSPVAYGDPTIVVDPLTGVSTLIWSNVSDLQIGDSLSVGFEATPRTSIPPAVFVAYPVGANVPFDAGAFGNTDPRTVPRFDATGAPIPSSYTQFDAASSSPTSITAITIDKSEPSPESELLRGLHTNSTVYTLDVDVTEEDGVDGVVVVDMLPAQLEFLGCGGVDNSSGPEFPGAPSLTVTPAVGVDCLTPTSVSTVENPAPDGTTVYPAGVYTRVVWDLGDLPAGANVTIRYAAAIGLRANTMDFAGPTPSETFPFAQTANVDNNNGASTRETTPETSVTNRSRVSGVYLGVVEAPATQDVFDTSNESVVIEDLRIRKSVSPGLFSAGGLATYTVVIDTSQYVSVSNPVLTDTIGNGLCPLDDVTNHTPTDVAECDPIATGPTVTDGVTTTALPYTSVTQLPSGGFDMVFTATAPIAANSTYTVTYQARMRSEYDGPLDGRPTVAGDSFSNDVDILATSTPIAGTGELGDEPVGDASGAGQGTLSQSLDKTVKPRVVGEDCTTGLGTYTDPTDPIAQGFGFRLGDDVCFRLTVDFASGVFNKNAVVTDFLPPGVAYTPASMVALGSNTVDFAFNETEAAADTANPVWEIGTVVGPDRYVAPGGRFDVVLAGTVNTVPATSPDITGNLMKMVVENTPGATSSFRDETPFALVPAVPLTLDKTVVAVDNPSYSPPPVQTSPFVQAGSTASYEIDVTHAGSVANGTDYSVRGLQVFDVLPQPIRCVDVTVTGAGAAFADCFDDGELGHPSTAGDTTRSVIVWDFVVDLGDVDADALFVGDTKTLTYDIEWPAGIAPEVTFTNVAGVRSYEAFTSEFGVGEPYYPADNIDASILPARWTAPAADDTAEVRTRQVTVNKLFTSPILPGNTGPATPGTSGQAVIGEVITYYYSVTIPAGTTVYDGRLTDALPSGWVVEPSPSATFTYEPDAAGAPGVFAPAPANVALNTTNGRLDFGDGTAGVYTNSLTTDQRFTVTVNVIATGNGVNLTAASTNRNNTARFQAATVDGGSDTAINRAQARTIAVVQPTPTLTKTNNTGGAPVAGGQTVRYTLTASQPTGRPTLYDSWIVDCLPSGLTFAGNVTMTTQLGAGPQTATPFTQIGPTAGPVDGCALGTTRLGWRLDDLPANTTIRVAYDVTVDVTAVGGDTYTNTAVLSGSSLNDGDRVTPDVPANPLERTYTRTPQSPNTVTVAGSAPTKTVDKPTATIGEVVTYTASGSIGANTNFYQTALVDTLPAGVDRSSVTLTSAVCTYTVSGDPCPGIAGSLWAPGSGPGGNIVFFYGDIAADPLARTLTAVYTAEVSDVAGNTRGVALTNSVNVRWDVTNDPDPTSLPYTWDRQSLVPATATATVVEPNLVTSKTVNDPEPALDDTFTYTVTLRNTGTNLSSAYNMVVVDTVPAGIVVGTISDGGTFDAGTREITWDATDLPGPLAPNATLNLTYTATFDDSTDPADRLLFGDDPLVNTVDNDSYDSLPADGRDYIGNSAVANVAADFPTVTLSKAVISAPPAYIGAPVTWQISGTNTGDGTAATVDVVDALPENWEFVSGTSSVIVGTDIPVVTDPAVSGPSDAVELEWELGAVLAGESFTITFQARPTTAVATSPGVGASIAQTNTVAADVTDVTGASGNSSRVYNPPSANASTRIDAADLEITSTTPATAVAGTPHTWTLTVTNNGPDTAVGPFTVTNTVPPGTSFSSATGAGWSCTHDGALTGGVVTCVRTNANDTLAVGASFPPIALVVDIDSDTPADTVYTDDAEASMRTYDRDLSNNTDDASTTVTGRADIRVSKSHTGSGVAGTLVNWTVTVDNLLGPSTSRANIVTVDTLPFGVTFVGFQFVDPDLSCVHDGLPAGAITCTRTTDMAVGEVDTFTFTARINRNWVADVTNTAVVVPTTFDPTPNTASDTVDVSTSADLAIGKTILGTVEAGSSGQYRITVDNLIGPSDAGAFSFTDTLPAGVTVTGIATNTGGATCGTFPANGSVTCTYAAGIGYGQTYTLTFDVTVASDVTGTITNDVELNPGVTPDPNPANDTASVSSGVNVDADLSVVKAGPATVTAGDDITWTLTVTNNGPSDDPATITVVDVLPAEVVYDAPVGDPTGEWACVHDGATSGGTLTCTNPNGLVTDETHVLTVNAGVLPDAGPAASSNAVSVSSPTTDTNPDNNNSTAPFTIVDDVNVSVTKTTVGADPVRAGETTSFRIDVTNDGPSTADNVVVTDTVASGMTIVSFAAPAGWTCDTGAAVCSTAELAPSTTAQIVVNVTVAASVLDGDTLTNTATVSTTSPGDDPGDNSDSADVDVDAEADLVIVKAHDGSQVRAGENTTFTFTVDNVAGPSNAAADIDISDVLPVGFTFIAATGPWDCVAGDPATVGGQPVTCTYVTGGVPANLPAGATAGDLTMTVASASSLAPSTLRNTAEVRSPTVDPDTTNNSSFVDVVVVTETDLTITKTVTDSPAVIGEAVTWTVVVTNQGPSDAFDVTVTDTVAASVTAVTADGGLDWTCDVVDNDVSCVHVGSLAALDSAEFTITGTVTAAAYPELVNSATVSTSTPEPDVDDNTATSTTPVAVQADLGVTKTHVGTPQVGGQVTYTLTATNYGPTENTGPVVMTDVVPAGLTFVSATGTGWSCTLVDTTVTCTYDATLAVDESTTVTLVAAVEPEAWPSVTNVVSVTSPHTDVNPDNDVASDPTPVEPLIVMTFTKSVGVIADGVAPWVLQVTNDGPNATVGALQIVDTLPDNLRFRSYSGPGWVCQHAAQVVTCVNDATLALGESSTLTIFTTVLAAPGETITNSATLVGGGSTVTLESASSATLPMDQTPTEPPTTPPPTGPDTGIPTATTGADTGQLVNVALMLLAAGALLRLFSSKRRQLFS